MRRDLSLWTLPNAARCLYLRLPRRGSQASLTAVMRAGAAAEGRLPEGTAHALEHVVVGPASRDCIAETHHDYTFFEQRSPAGEARPLLELLRRLAGAGGERAFFPRALLEVREDIRQWERDAFAVLCRRLYGRLYVEPHRRRLAIGRPGVRLSWPAARDLWARQYAGASLVVALAGIEPAADMRAAVEEALALLPAAGRGPSPAPPVPLEGSRAAPPPAPAGRFGLLMAGFRVPELSDLREGALALNAVDMLLTGYGCRLRRALLLAPKALIGSVPPAPAGGVYEVYCGPLPSSRVPEGAAILLAELRRLARSGPRAGETRRVKMLLQARNDHAQAPPLLMQSLAFAEAFGGGHRGFFEIRERLRRLTGGTIAAVAGRLLRGRFDFAARSAPRGAHAASSAL